MEQKVPFAEMSTPHALSVATAIAPLNLKESNMCATLKFWKNQFKISSVIDTAKYNELVSKFAAYFIPKVNI